MANKATISLALSNAGLILSEIRDLQTVANGIQLRLSQAKDSDKAQAAGEILDVAMHQLWAARSILNNAYAAAAASAGVPCEV